MQDLNRWQSFKKTQQITFCLGHNYTKMAEFHNSNISPSIFLLSQLIVDQVLISYRHPFFLSFMKSVHEGLHLRNERQYFYYFGSASTCQLQICILDFSFSCSQSRSVRPVNIPWASINRNRNYSALTIFSCFSLRRKIGPKYKFHSIQIGISSNLSRQNSYKSQPKIYLLLAIHSS